VKDPARRPPQRWGAWLAAALLTAAACGSPAGYQLARERGDTALQIGDVEDALDAYREALAYEPRNPHALLGLGRCENALGDGEAALDVFGRLAGVDPDFFARDATTDHRFALYQAAEQAWRRGDSTLALRRLRRLRELDPDHGGLDALEREVLIAEGGRLQVAGQEEAAEALFIEALGRDEDWADPEAAAAMAEVLMERGQLDGAISVLSDALLRSPGDARLQGLMDRALEIRYPR